MTFRTKVIDSPKYICDGANCARVDFQLHKTQLGSNSRDQGYIPNPYTMTLSEVLPSYEHWENPFAPQDRGYANTPSATVVSANWTDNDTIKLLNKLRKKYDKHDFNAGVAGAELGRATDSLADRIGQLASAGRLARKGNFSGALKTLGAKASDSALRGEKRRFSSTERRQRLTDLNLEFQFGIRPLVDDIYSLSESITNMSKTRGARIAVRRKVPGVVTMPTGYGGSGVQFESHSIVALLEQEEPTLPERMGLANPASILWEVMPWSFVLDWALPIGDWIDAQSFALRSRGTYVHTKYTYLMVNYGGVTAGHPATVQGYLVQPPTGGFTKSLSVQRDISSSLSVPPPALKSSLLGGKPLERLANAFSLLVGLGAGKRSG